MRKFAEVETIYLPISNYSFGGLIRNIKYVLRHLNNNKYDIIHITGSEHYLLPFLYGRRSVVTVHDLGRLINLKGMRRLRYWLMQVADLKCATAITCISSKTYQEVKRNIFISKGKMVMIPNALDKKYYSCYKEFNSSCPIILHIGTSPNKNLNRSIIALRGIKCKLRIVGKIGQSDMDLLKVNQIDYSMVYDLSNDEILQEYKNADIISFPSYYEGFGMPIIEGQAIGRLVITSEIEPMKSVAGDGAIFCNPYDVDSIRNAYLKGFNNCIYRDCIIRAGLENVKKYNLEPITEKYYNLYQSLS